MRKLLLRTGLFLLPLLALLLALPVERHWRYQGLENDCSGHGAWIYDRIFENERPIDIAFFGSSNTLNALDDSLLEARLGTGERVANLGYCRLGRNLTYVLLKDLLREKRPRMILVEVRQHESRYSHPIFPYLAAEKDLLLPAPFFNRDLLSDAWEGGAYKLQGLQEKLWHSWTPSPYQPEPYGFGGLPQTAATDTLEKVKIRRQRREQAARGWREVFYQTYPNAYLKKISRLCRKEGVELVFLYMPTYGTSLQQPSSMEVYEQLGQVWLPPFSIFENPAFWMDENHLNLQGAAALTEWVAARISTINQ